MNFAFSVIFLSSLAFAEVHLDLPDCKASIISDPQKASMLKERLDFLNDKVKGLQKNYMEIHDKYVFKQENFKINKYVSAENCILGTAIEAFDKDSNLVKVEEGPINLRKVVRLNKSGATPEESFGFALRFVGEKAVNTFPTIYFAKSKYRDNAYSAIEDLRLACRERYSTFLELYGKEEFQPGEFKIPESFELGARPVRLLEDDPTQRAALLINGHQAFAARLKISEEAKKPGDSLLIEYLIYMADEAGLRLGEELIKKRSDGVRVEVVIDALSPFMDVRDITVRENTKLLYNNLMTAGIPVYGYRCGLHHHLVDEVKFSLAFNTRTYDQRPHEKFWIVNGQKAVMGGMNIGNDYFRLNEAGFGYWRDQDVLVEGRDLVQDAVNIFEGNIQTYRNNFLDPKKDTCFNPHDPVTETQEYIRFKMKYTEPYRLRRLRGDKKDFQAHAMSEIKRIEWGLKNKDPEFDFHFEKIKAGRVVQNRPKLGELQIEEVYVDLINSAKAEVIISNAYFIPSLPIKKALHRAAKRGVKVVVLTNSYDTNDVPPVALLGRHYYKELVDFNYGEAAQNNGTHEVEIFEWTGDGNADGKLEQGTNHAKFMVVDRKIVLIGSYNLDPRSRNINSESGLVFEGENHRLAKRLVKEFYEVDLKYAKKVRYRQMMSYRRPVDMLKAIAMKMAGFDLEESSFQKGKEFLFYAVATYDESTW